jgi:DNA primase
MAEERPFLDFKAIKARASITSILDRYGITLSRANRDTLRGNCPLPSHSSKSKNTFYVSETKSAWYCHSDSCKKNGQRAGGNIIDFVALMEQCPVYAAAKRIDEMFPATANPVPPANAQHDGLAPEAVPSVSTAGANEPLTFTLKDVNPAHPMIQERGISIATATTFGVGFFSGKGSMAGRIVFPLHENGVLVGYAGRTTLPLSDTNPKWLMGKGIRKTFLYGLERCDAGKPLVLVESPWAVLWLNQNGGQAAALLGSEMTEAQEECLEPFGVITVALDNDAAGNEKAGQIIARLRRNHKVLKARLME